MPDEADYPAYLNWLYHSDATLTFPQTVVLRYKLQEPGVADAAVEGYKDGLFQDVNYLKQLWKIKIPLLKPIYDCRYLRKLCLCCCRIVRHTSSIQTKYKKIY